MLHSRLEKV